MTSQTRVTFHLPFPAFALAMLGLLTMIATAPALAQTFTVLHTFTGGTDGSSPYFGVTVARPGLLYGTTYGGGTYSRGVAFALRNSGSGWTLNPLHEFGDGSDGQDPTALVTVGPNGAIYGTTESGGSANAGTVFELQPPASACLTALCYWNESILHSFQGGTNDGAVPTRGALIFDQAGNIYGMTSWGGGGPCNLGGEPGCGTVFELTPSGSGWTENVLHSFDGSDGDLPGYGLIFDTAGPAGNLYGTTNYGGSYGGSDGDGTAFELSPSGGGTWTETVLYNFNCFNGGCLPTGTLIHDASGNLYGSVYQGEAPSSAYELSYSNGGWDFSSISASGGGPCEDYGGVAMDTAGNIYGTCLIGGAYNDGWVFKLTNSGGNWTTTDLHDFNGSDGSWVYSGVTLDSSGNLYGTTFYGGDFGCNDGLGCGTVWEITP